MTNNDSDDDIFVFEWDENDEHPDPAINSFAMVECFIQQISEDYPKVRIEDLAQALIACAAKISCVYAESLDMFRARSVLAYEKIKVATVRSGQFGCASEEVIVDLSKGN